MPRPGLVRRVLRRAAAHGEFQRDDGDGVGFDQPRRQPARRDDGPHVDGGFRRRGGDVFLHRAFPKMRCAGPASGGLGLERQEMAGDGGLGDEPAARGVEHRLARRPPRFSPAIPRRRGSSGRARATSRTSGRGRTGCRGRRSRRRRGGSWPARARPASIPSARNLARTLSNALSSVSSATPGAGVALAMKRVSSSAEP